MRAVIQRVKHSSVCVDGETVGKIGAGLLILVGVSPDDDESDIDYIVKKSIGLRIFEDEDEKMNLSVSDIGGEILLISQFTLFGDCRKGRRPSFASSCEPVKAEKMYNELIRKMRDTGIKTECGIFGADMRVDLMNDGPVTILLDSKKLF